MKRIMIEAIAAGAAGGLLVWVAPERTREQVMYGAIAAVPSVIAIAEGWRYTSKLREEVTEQRRELERVRVLQDKARENLDRRAAEIELRMAEVRSQQFAVEEKERAVDFEMRRQAGELDRELQKKAIELERVRTEIEGERAALAASIRKWEEVDKQVLTMEIRAGLEAERQEAIARWEKHRSDLREEELARVREQENELMERAIALEKSRADWEIERLKKEQEHADTISNDYQGMQQAIAQQQAQMQKQVYEQESARFNQQREAWIMELERIKQENANLARKVIILNEKLAEQRKPVRPQGTTPSHAIAYFVQDWFLANGVPWDFISIQWLEDRGCWCIVCDPWWAGTAGGTVQIKDFARLAKISQSGLKLIEPLMYDDSPDGFKLWVKPVLSPDQKVKSYLSQLKDGLASGADYVEFDERSQIPQLPESKHEQARLERKNFMIKFSGTAFTQGYYDLDAPIDVNEELTVEFWQRYQEICFGKDNLTDMQAIAKIYGIIPKKYSTANIEYDRALERLTKIKQSLRIE